MRWLLPLVLAAGVVGLAWSFPVLKEVSQFTDDTVITPRTINSILVFFASSIVWAIYLGIIIARWFAQRFIDIIFTLRGPAYTRPKPPGEAELSADPEKNHPPRHR